MQVFAGPCLLIYWLRCLLEAKKSLQAPASEGYHSRRQPPLSRSMKVAEGACGGRCQNKLEHALLLTLIPICPVVQEHIANRHPLISDSVATVLRTA